nr:PTS galactosamine/N-acetylgalactosamine transporter subunit IIA [uncultured Moellerella sp.]
MIGLIVSGHINFASGMASAVAAITGAQQKIAFIDFVETISPDELEAQMRSAIAEMDSSEGYLFLTDLPGGTPCNRAMAVMMSCTNIEVLSGINLPMIINAVFEREDCELKELVAVLQEIGAESIQNVRHQLSLSESDIVQSDDGI